MAMATHRQTERYLKPLLRKLSSKVIIMGKITRETLLASLSDTHYMYSTSEITIITPTIYCLVRPLQQIFLTS